MKFKISFELDAGGTSYSIKDKNDEVSLVLQNLSFIFQQLQNDVPLKKLNMLVSNNTESFKDAAIKHIEEEGKLVSQIFNKWKVEGTMEDGKTFTFSTENPKERLVFNP